MRHARKMTPLFNPRNGKSPSTKYFIYLYFRYIEIIGVSTLKAVYSRGIPWYSPYPRARFMFSANS